MLPWCSGSTPAPQADGAGSTPAGSTMNTRATSVSGTASLASNQMGSVRVRRGALATGGGVVPGPAPKDPAQRRRRNATPGFKILPHVGREGDPPEWPIAGEMDFDERRLWTRLWKLPQAVEWERM